MSAAAIHAGAPQPNAPNPGDAKYIATLDRLIARGETLVDDLVDEAVPTTEKAVPFERIAGAVRRTIALARHIIANQPDPAKTVAEVTKTKAATTRRRIARAIDDEIARAATAAADLAALRAELHERLDDPALDLDIANRPIDAIIADIRRDLGLANHGPRSWPRRTPEDARALDRLAGIRQTEDDEPSPELAPDDDNIIRPRTFRDG